MDSKLWNRNDIIEPMRITIIGNCGSGKSTLAREISEKFNIPHIHLDRFWFDAGGHMLKKDDLKGKEIVRERLREKIYPLIAEESWVSDGFYRSVQPMITARADAIIFLDIPLWRRLINHVHRMFFAERHPELSAWDDFKFIPEIVRRTFTHGVQMQTFAKENAHKVVHFHSYKEVEKYVASLG